MNYPDHNTIWRFFNKNKERIKNIFQKTIHIALDNNLIGLALQAIDGTKIKASANRSKALHKKDLEKLLSKLNEHLGKVMEEIIQTEHDEFGKPPYGLPKWLQNKNNLEKLIDGGLEKYSEPEQKDLREIVQKNIKELDNKNKKSFSITDPECRMMKNKSSRDYCYNAQATVDARSQIIVGAKITNEESDSHQMTAMLDESKTNCNKKTTETLLDGGYFSGSELKKVEENDYSVITPVNGKVGKSTKKGQDPRFTKDKFEFDSKEDSYICPMGKKLRYMHTSSRKSRDYSVRKYGCKNYKECKFRDLCSKDKTGRKIERSPFDDEINRQNTKNDLKINREIYKQRKHIVEPVFGWIKHNNGFNKWLYRGLKNVDAQWNLVCTGINLHKLFKVWKENGLKLE